jgi:hypothetical protein
MDPTIFKKFVDNLKGNSESTHLESLDVTWNIPNLILNSNELLLIVLAKTAMIPFIPDYTTTANDLGLTNEQASSIQESNELVLVLHKMIQQYCIQQFSIGSMMKKKMDNIILAAPEIKDVQSIDDLLNYMNDFKKAQTAQIQEGGLLGPGDILKIIGTLILFTFVSTTAKSDGISLGNPQGNQTNQLVLINGDNIIQPYNQQMVNMSLEDFSQALQERETIKAKHPIDVNKIIVKYDKTVEKKKTQILGQFLGLFSSPQSGIELLDGIINDFNSELLHFSQDVETTCVELMDKANEKGVFGHYMDIDTMAETEQKLADIERDVKKHNSELNQDVAGAAAAAVVSVGTAVVTGDVITMAAYVVSLGNTVFESFASTKNIAQQQQILISKNTSLTAQSDKPMTPSEKQLLEDNIYQFSKVYCSYGYHLQLRLNENSNTIDVVGDKIEYVWLINVINVLESNIDLKISNSIIRKELNKYELNSLNSLKQRIQVLKAITIKLRFIVNFSLQSQISTLNQQPTERTLNEIDNYFNNQLKDLSTMLESIKKQFPKREEDLKQEALLTETKTRLDKVEDALKLQEQEAENERQTRINIITQRNSEMIAQNISENWISTKTIMTAWVTLFGNNIRFVGESAGNTTSAVGEAAFEIPLAGVQATLGFLDSVVWLFLKSPSGCAIFVGVLFLVTFWIAGINSVIYIFRKGVEVFVAVITFGIMTVYKLIKTPFGLIFRKQDAIAYPRLRDAAPLGTERDVRIPGDNEMNAAVAKLLGLQFITGGKIRTKSQRHKNKVKKTRRKNKTKSKNTTKRGKKSRKHSKRRK